jgi:hypothetical protein
MPPLVVALAALVLALLLQVPGAEARQSRETGAALRVFLDCNRCDSAYLRTEITFVNHVRDRKQAEVHVLVTAERTGSGGTKYTLEFIGLERFDGITQQLTYASEPAATDDEVRRGLAQVIKLGLVRYVAETEVGRNLRIDYRPADTPGAATAARPDDDPWDFWIFRIRGNGNVNGERSSTRQFFNGSLSSNRTTEEWKISLSAYGNYSGSDYTFEDGTTYTSFTRSYDTRGLVVNSLGPHWSVAGRASLGGSTYNNLDRAIRASGGIEFNVFPYSESTRRALWARYFAGVHALDYIDETIYGKTEETLWNEAVEAGLNLRQPWGTSELAVEFSHYFHDPSKNRLDVSGELEVRLFKGFVLNGYGNYSRIRDQIFLPKGDIPPEEVLTFRRQLATSYRFNVGLGISYTFGSIYNNVVNPRFDGF